jgi:hypothetical protein
MMKMNSQKLRREKIKYPIRTERCTRFRERNKMKEEKEDQRKLLCPKAGTATLSPAIKTPSQSNMNILNVML